jgi:hypothetical protein
MDKNQLYAGWCWLRNHSKQNINYVVSLNHLTFKTKKEIVQNYIKYREEYISYLRLNASFRVQ